jgi:clan AA aspartic protease (TIGR02281 family)
VQFLLKKFQFNKLSAKAVAYIFIIFSFSLIFCEASQATLYKWKDEQGSIHFTSDPDTIPKEFQNQSEELNSNPAPTFSPAPLTTHETPIAQSLDIVVPMRQKGNQFFVKAILNGHLEVDLLLDTGATILVISEEVGESLGFNRRDNMPQIEAKTAGGKIWTPLIFLETVTAANAKAFAVEAVIGSKLDKIDGLLGMAFFEQFKMTLDRKKSQLILQSNISENETLYGGRPDYWWINKIRLFRSNQIYFERYAKKLAEENDRKAYNVEKTSEHYAKLFNRVRSSAQTLNVPLD